MVETVAVSNGDQFVEAVSDAEYASLSASQTEELWSLWDERISLFGDCVLVLVPEWFASDEFGARRPFLFAQVEYDDPDSGAVLFSDMYEVDISIVEQEVVDQLEFTEAVTKLDITNTDDYIDEPGKAWVPRSQMTVFDRTTDTADDGAASEATDPTAFGDSVLNTE